VLRHVRSKSELDESSVSDANEELHDQTHDLSLFAVIGDHSEVEQCCGSLVSSLDKQSEGGRVRHHFKRIELLCTEYKLIRYNCCITALTRALTPQRASLLRSKAEIKASSSFRRGS
jgi:hypothetical protein